MGAFLGYLSSAQQIFQDLYGQGLLFPFIFGTLALSLGCALFFNSRIVMRLGMRRLVDRAMMTFSVLSSAYFAIVCLFDGRSPFWMLMVFLLAAFFCIGFLFGNLNAIAMRPVMMSAMPGPRRAGGIFFSFSRSRIPAIARIASSHPMPLPVPKNTL